MESPLFILRILKEKVEEYRSKLIEAIVENNEELMNKYLAGEEIDVADLLPGLYFITCIDESDRPYSTRFIKE